MSPTMRQRLGWIAGLVAVTILLVVLFGGMQDSSLPAPDDPSSEMKASPAPGALEPARSQLSPLPPEARETLATITRGGPFAYRQDGSVFQNRERHLPERARGYYREYTVPTPGSRDRGPRRIITGGDPPSEYFYTSDHYRTFSRIEAPP